MAYDVNSAIEMMMKTSRSARWDVLANAMKTLEAGFAKKVNDKAWKSLNSWGNWAYDFWPIPMPQGKYRRIFRQWLVK